ncbi:MAG: tetratricopeptide repeat protein [Anaerolineae bacterium]|nr:tetratricopeptide repeat protein [Anaerolineae bacterium]
MSFFYIWSARMHRHFGIVFSRKAEYVSAVCDYTRAVIVNPRLVKAYLERGILLWRELGQAKQAVEDFTAVLGLHPACAEALFFRGLAYQGTSNYPEAIHDLSEYLATEDVSWREDAIRQLSLMRLIWDGIEERG